MLCSIPPRQLGLPPLTVTLHLLRCREAQVRVGPDLHCPRSHLGGALRWPAPVVFHRCSRPVATLHVGRHSAGLTLGHPRCGGVAFLPVGGPRGPLSTTC